MAIAKISRPRNAQECVKYILSSQDHTGRQRSTVAVITSTIGRSASNATRSLKAVGQLRPSLKRHLYHVSISVPPAERPLKNSEWARIGKAWCSDMGLENYLIVRHDDHIHIVASRIRLDGSAASDSYDYKRSEVILRQIEQQFDLQRTQASHLVDTRKRLVHSRTRTMAETFAIAQDQDISHKDYVRNAIDTALSNRCFVADLTTRLADFGIIMTVEQRSNCGRSALFAYHGRTYGAKSLGFGYSFEGLRARSELLASENGGAEEGAADPPWANLKPSEERPSPPKNPYREHALQKLKEKQAQATRIIRNFRTRPSSSKRATAIGEVSRPLDKPPIGKL